MIAYCFITGEIGFVAHPEEIPDRAIAFTDNITQRPELSDGDLVKIVRTKACFSDDAKTLMVPGVANAQNKIAAMQALKDWVAWAFEKTKEAA